MMVSRKDFDLAQSDPTHRNTLISKLQSMIYKLKKRQHKVKKKVMIADVDDTCSIGSHKSLRNGLRDSHDKFEFPRKSNYKD
jgi:hypothetical protein